MTLLTKPTPQGIRDNLKERLEAECIYTYIGNVLVAANPFTWLQIYSSDDAKRYMRQSRLDVPPHVFEVAEAAFRAMTEEEDSQCVIISGESGAGKTEASKHIQVGDSAWKGASIWRLRHRRAPSPSARSQRCPCHTGLLRVVFSR